MSAIETSLIIPCYFATPELVEATRRCLDSLKYGRPDEVIVIDDGSPMLPEPYGADRWLRLPANGGYVGAVNAGLERAQGDVLILGNNDIEFTPGWLEGILKPLREGYDVASIITSDQGYEQLRDEVTEGDRFGSLFAMKRKVYERVGGFDPQFRNYFGDTDLHMRISEAGFKVAKNWGALVEHQGGGTIKTVQGANDFETAKDVFKAKWGFII